MHRIMDNIPLGQPILVGHHSETHARRDANRIDSSMRRGVEESEKAKHHIIKAAGLSEQLNRSIFSDDTDVTEQLEERIAEREAKAAAMVAMNKAWRSAKGDVARFAALAGIDESQAQRIADRIAQAYSWEKQPYPGWELSNLRGRIRADKERMTTVKAQQARSEQAEANGGVIIEGTDYVRVTFAEKPEYDIITALKSAGFTWSRGSWYGRRDKLPDLRTEEEDLYA